MHNQQSGFTLIEILVTVAIVAILASVAIPSYTDHVRRSQLSEATTNLSDMRVRLEQFYQDNRTYLNTTLPNPLGDCGVLGPTGGAARYFTYDCDTKNGGQGFDIIATGIAGSPTDDFVYTIDERNVRGTDGIHLSWGGPNAPVAHKSDGANPMWLIRKP
jgi:type IV pilus assembly protein PilE